MLPYPVRMGWLRRIPLLALAGAACRRDGAAAQADPTVQVAHAPDVAEAPDTAPTAPPLHQCSRRDWITKKADGGCECRELSRCIRPDGGYCPDRVYASRCE
jgi:hypothetical protein